MISIILRWISIPSCLDWYAFTSGKDRLLVRPNSARLPSAHDVQVLRWFDSLETPPLDISKEPRNRCQAPAPTRECPRDPRRLSHRGGGRPPAQPAVPAAHRPAAPGLRGTGRRHRGSGGGRHRQRIRCIQGGRAQTSAYAPRIRAPARVSKGFARFTGRLLPGSRRECAKRLLCAPRAACGVRRRRAASAAFPLAGCGGGGGGERREGGRRNGRRREGELAGEVGRSEMEREGGGRERGERALCVMCMYAMYT